VIDSKLVGRGTTRADDAQGTPTQRRISTSILVYEDASRGVEQPLDARRTAGLGVLRGQAHAGKGADGS